MQCTLGFGCLLFWAVANQRCALGQAKVKGQKRSVLHADGPQGRAINLWESRRSKVLDVKLKKKQHFRHTRIRRSRSQFSTCGVRLLSTNQQLSRELPSLQDEPKIETEIQDLCIHYFLWVQMVFCCSSGPQEWLSWLMNRTMGQIWCLNKKKTTWWGKWHDWMDGWMDGLPLVLEPLPQPRLANRGPPPDQGDGDGCFWLASPGGGRDSWLWLLPRLAFQDLCPIGSGGQLVL